MLQTTDLITLYACCSFHPIKSYRETKNKRYPYIFQVVNAFEGAPVLVDAHKVIMCV